MELEDIHLGILIITFLIMAYSDEMGLSWVMGWKQTLDPKKLAILHKLMWAGLLGMIGTGIILVIPQLPYRLSDTMFITKMMFVLVLVINAVAIGKLQDVATVRPFKDLTTAERLPLFASGVISVVSWVCAAVIGYFFL